jgi:hypothetical protein
MSVFGGHTQRVGTIYAIFTRLYPQGYIIISTLPDPRDVYEAGKYSRYIK